MPLVVKMFGCAHRIRATWICMSHANVRSVPHAEGNPNYSVPVVKITPLWSVLSTCSHHIHLSRGRGGDSRYLYTGGID